MQGKILSVGEDLIRSIAVYVYQRRHAPHVVDEFRPAIEQHPGSAIRFDCPRRIRASCDYLEPVAGPDEVTQCEQAHPSVDKAHRPPRCDRAIRLPRVNGSACKTRSEDLQIGRGVDIPHDEVRRAGEKSREVKGLHGKTRAQMRVDVDRDGVTDGSAAGKRRGPQERQGVRTAGRRGPRVRVDAISRDAIAAESIIRQSDGHVAGRDSYRDSAVRIRALDIQNSQRQWLPDMVVLYGRHPRARDWNADALARSRLNASRNGGVVARQSSIGIEPAA